MTCIERHIHSQLAADGFARIGRFHCDGHGFFYQFDRPDAQDWLFSVYAWVSLLGDGQVIRIGKCEGRLASRIRAYRRSLDGTMFGDLGPYAYFKGDTQPWERAGWLAYASGPQGGAIYARQVATKPGQVSAKAVACLESTLIMKYDPPLCGVSRQGRKNKKAWIAIHGSAIPISRRCPKGEAARSGAEAPAGPGQSPGLPALIFS